MTIHDSLFTPIDQRETDRAALAERNRLLAERRHQPTSREVTRNSILRLIARLPAPRIEPPIPGTFLLIRPDHLGDVLLSTPAIRALARSEPQAQLYGLTGEWAAPVFSAYDEMYRVLTLPFPGFVRGGSRPPILEPYRMLLHYARRLRGLRAEVAIIMRPDHWWGALLAWLAGIPTRVGFALPEVRPFLTHPIPFQRDHVVRQSLRLVERWTGPIPDSAVTLEFPNSEGDRTAVESLLIRHSVPDNAPRVAIHPGAGTAIKRWSSKAWAAVADALAERWQATILFTGSTAERSEIEAIRSDMAHGSVSLAGETDLGMLAALYASVRVVIGLDSGPLHLAVASGTPTVHLYGPADPAEFAPWGDPDRHIVLTTAIGCRPCRILDWPDSDAINHPCIRDIAPVRVIAAAMQAVSASPDRSISAITRP